MWELCGIVCVFREYVRYMVCNTIICYHFEVILCDVCGIFYLALFYYFYCYFCQHHSIFLPWKVLTEEISYRYFNVLLSLKFAIIKIILLHHTLYHINKQNPSRHQLAIFPHTYSTFLILTIFPALSTFSSKLSAIRILSIVLVAASTVVVVVSSSLPISQLTSIISPAP